MKKIILIVSIIFSCLISIAQGKYIQGKIDQIPKEYFKEKHLFNLKSTTSENYDFYKDVSSFTLADVSSVSLKDIVNTYENALEIQVPYEGGTLTLLLAKNNAVSENTVITSQHEKVKSRFNYKLGAYYYGVVKDIPNSVVGISFFENDIIGTVSIPEGNIVIGKSKQLSFDSEEYIIYNDKNLKIENHSACGMTEDIAGKNIPRYNEVKKHTRALTTNCVKFYVECDYKCYQDFGNNVTNTTNFATGLYNLVSTLYLNDSVVIAVSEINVWTTLDPYAGGASTLDALYDFSDEMSNNGFNGDLAHLLSRRNIGGGIAWLDVLCSTDYYKCGVSASLSTTLTPLPTYSWNSMVVTHECGHNIASPHTHACAWNGNNTRIDNCAGNYDIQYQEGNCNSFPPDPPSGGTIMSYCHLQAVGINLSLGFGPQPGALIRSSVNSAGCLTTCENCNADIIITGTYSDTLIESNTWIRSSGQTTILNTASVRLDPNPSAGYVLLSPASNSDFFVASPSNGSSFFVSQAYDGCSGAAPQRPGNENAGEEINEISNAASDFILYPNPTSNNINISNAALDNQLLSYEIYSIDGKLLSGEKDIIFNGSYAVNLNKISTGLYFIKIMSQGKINTMKFQKH